MNFLRQRIPKIDPDRLRSLAARSGWLIETPEMLRAGFGRVMFAASLPLGLDGPLPDSNPFDGAVVTGETAPTHFGPIAFAAVPFDRSGTIRIWVPEHVIALSADACWLTTAGNDEISAMKLVEGEAVPDQHSEYQVHSMMYAPSPDGYARAVASAVEEMRHSSLQKVVLARQVTGTATEPLDAAVVIRRLHDREPVCTLYAFPGEGDVRYVGASPELIVESLDGSVASHPLAGTVALPEGTSPSEYAQWLMGSSKNLFEHRVVVEDIVERLATRCVEVRADARPSIVALRSVAHLGTWVYAKIDERSPVSVLELLSLLHPTAAVGGIPQQHALEVIARLEPEDRGLYAGAVGWFDADGSGAWWLAIRGLVLSGDRFTAWAGAGIVADSDPVAEREETRNKLASILVGLGPLVG